MLVHLARVATAVAVLTLAATAHAADDSSPLTPLRLLANPDARYGDRPLPRAPPPRPKTVTLTADILQLVAPYVVLTSELRVARRWSFAMTAGGGVRQLDILGGNATTTALELGLEPRFFVLGDFENGLYVGWSTRFARDVHGPVGFESLDTPPGLSTGAVVGFKSVDVPIITPDFSVGLLVPLATPSSEPSPPPVAVVVRLGIGFSL